MSNARTRYQTIAAGFTDRLAGVPAEAWDGPTPCPDWTVRRLVSHVIDTHWRVLARLPDVDAREAAADEPLAPQRPAVRDEVLAALSAERAATVVGGLGGGQTFGQLADTLLSADLLLHTWDLARATGQDERLDPAAVTAARAFLGPLDEPIRQPGGFGPRVAAPPGADEQTELLAFCGRRPTEAGHTA